MDEPLSSSLKSLDEVVRPLRFLDLQKVFKHVSSFGFQEKISLKVYPNLIN